MAQIDEMDIDEGLGSGKRSRDCEASGSGPKKQKTDGCLVTGFNQFMSSCASRNPFLDLSPFEIFTHQNRDVFVEILHHTTPPDGQSLSCVSAFFYYQMWERGILSLFFGDKATDSAVSKYLERRPENVKVVDFQQCWRLTNDSLKSFGLLTNLLRIWITDCPTLSDAAMAYLTPLPNLKQLSLGSPQISNAGLAHIGVLTTLSTLFLPRVCQITPHGLSALHSCRELTYLQIPENCGVDEGLQHLTHLTKLKAFNPLYNITNNGMQLLNLLPNLTTISFSRGMFTDVGFIDHFNPSKLTNLMLMAPLLTNASLAHLATFSGLQALYFFNNFNVTNIGLTHLALLPQLKVLSIKNCAFGHGDFRFSKLTSLTTLTVHYPQLNDDALIGLDSLQNLSRLSLTGCVMLSNRSISTTFRITSLEELQISTPVTPLGLAQIQCTALKELQLLDCTYLTDSEYENFRCLGSLTMLHLGKAHGLTDKGFEILCSLSQLTSLGGVCPLLTDTGFSNIKNLNLQRLSIAAIQLTNEGFRYISTQTNLNGLRISSQALADEGLEHLCAIQTLQVLRFQSCPLITDTGILRLATLKALRLVDVIRCVMVTEAAQEELKETIEAKRNQLY